MPFLAHNTTGPFEWQSKQKLCVLYKWTQLDISFALTHTIELPSAEVKTHDPNPSNSHYLQWISSPTASAKRYSTSTDCSDDGWVGGGLWEWLDRVAPTPHWPEQQTECTRSSAKDKASAIMCGGTAVCVFCVPPGPRLTFKPHSFLRWSLEGAEGCQSQVGCDYALHGEAI